MKEEREYRRYWERQDEIQKMTEENEGGEEGEGEERGGRESKGKEIRAQER